jgi:hypothetical protein
VQARNARIKLDCTRLGFPEVEKGDYLQELIAREAGLPGAPDPVPVHNRFDNLSDLLLSSPFAGANVDLERSKDHPRAVDLE